MAWLVENWRDAILIVVGLLGVYVVFSVMRLVQVSRSATRVSLHDLRHEHLAPELSDPLPDPAAVAEPLWEPSHEPVAEPPPATPAAPSRLSRFARWTQGEPEATTEQVGEAVAAGEFASELRQSNLEVEVAQLRHESEVLRQELAAVHEELALLKAARNVSPLYSEAASLAQKGVPADGIAGQCGISLGEAELVAALARADGRNGRVEPTEYLDSGDAGASNGRGHDGQAHRNRRTGTHG